MTEHAPLRIASCTTCVDQAAALTWLLLGDLGSDDLVTHGLTKLQEVFPEVESRARCVLWKCCLSIDDERLDFGILVKIHRESLQVLSSLDYNHLCISVCRLVQNCLCRVCDVNARIDLVVHESTKESDGPLGCVEAHDSHSRLVSAVELMAGLCKAHSILVVLVPRPAQLLIIAFDPHGRSVATRAHCIHKRGTHGEGNLRARSSLTHLDWQLIMDVGRPVETFTVHWVDQALVPVRGHRHNAIV